MNRSTCPTWGFVGLQRLDGAECRNRRSLQSERAYDLVAKKYTHSLMCCQCVSGATVGRFYDCDYGWVVVDTRPSKIIIRGDSVAAWCCVHLLTRAGFNPVLKRTARPRLPAIMLSEAALALIRDVFANPGLFRAGHRIT